jgi:hypothetical protein
MVCCEGPEPSTIGHLIRLRPRADASLVKLTLQPGNSIQTKPNSRQLTVVDLHHR